MCYETPDSSDIWELRDAGLESETLEPAKKRLVKASTTLLAVRFSAMSGNATSTATYASGSTRRYERETVKHPILVSVEQVAVRYLSDDRSTLYYQHDWSRWRYSKGVTPLLLVCESRELITLKSVVLKVHWKGEL